MDGVKYSGAYNYQRKQIGGQIGPKTKARIYKFPFKCKGKKLKATIGPFSSQSSDSTRLIHFCQHASERDFSEKKICAAFQKIR